MAIIYSSQDALNQAKLIQSTIDGVSIAIGKADPAKIDSSFIDGYHQFLDEWATYKKQLNSFAGTVGSWDDLMEYKSQADAWRQKAASLGAPVPYRPDVTPQDTSTALDRAGKTIFASVPWWLWLGGAGLLIWKLQPVKTAKDIKGLMAPRRR
jgi:hypothetical protein